MTNPRPEVREVVSIPFKVRFREPLLNGTKVYTSRTKRMGKVGDTFQAFGATFEILSVEDVALHEVARLWKEEGCASEEEFKQVWREIHPRVGYNEYNRVFLHHFRKLSAPPIEPVGMREALERCLTEMKKTAISIRKEAGYKAVHRDFIGAIEQACVALAATPVPMVEEVVTVLAVRDHNWGCGFDAEDMPGKIKLCAYSTTKVNEGDRVRVVVYKEE